VFPHLRSFVALLGLQPTGDGASLCRRLKSASFELTMQPLSQAWRLGSLRLPHQYLSGAAISPSACIHGQLRSNDSTPACPGIGATDLQGVIRSFHRHAFVTHLTPRIISSMPVIREPGQPRADGGCWPSASTRGHGLLSGPRHWISACKCLLVVG
jgi:hypothetical protein